MATRLISTITRSNITNHKLVIVALTSAAVVVNTQVYHSYRRADSDLDTRHYTTGILVSIFTAGSFTQLLSTKYHAETDTICQVHCLTVDARPLLAAIYNICVYAKFATHQLARNVSLFRCITVYGAYVRFV